MWIISSNKRTLVNSKNCKAISIYQLGPFYHLYAYSGEDPLNSCLGIELGEYETEEDALLALTEIEDGLYHEGIAGDSDFFCENNHLLDLSSHEV